MVFLAQRPPRPDQRLLRSKDSIVVERRENHDHDERSHEHAAPSLYETGALGRSCNKGVVERVTARGLGTEHHVPSDFDHRGREHDTDQTGERQPREIIGNERVDPLWQ